MLDAEPDIDLVVLNGDLITGDNTFLENSTDYVDQIVRPFAERGLTWASTYGNHDNHFNISAARILERERHWPNSRTTQMVSAPDADTGVSNYYLPVYPPDCDPASPSPSDCPPKLLLWFFDSRGGFRCQQRNATTDALIPLPNWVDARVVDWFKQTNTDLLTTKAPSGTPPIPALAFVHIPPDASRTLQSRGIHPHRQPGLDDDGGPLARQAQGWCADGSVPAPGEEEEEAGCEYGGQDGPFLEALATTPGMMALFSGHDHGETWCARWEGMASQGGEGRGEEVEGSGLSLCFGQHSGYGGYGRWIRGARQVVVSLEGLAERVVETYIRLESGETVGAVTLNATYGQDWYPATPNDKTRLPTGDD